MKTYQPECLGPLSKVQAIIADESCFAVNATLAYKTTCSDKTGGPVKLWTCSDSQCDSCISTIVRNNECVGNMLFQCITFNGTLELINQYQTSLALNHSYHLDLRFLLWLLCLSLM